MIRERFSKLHTQWANLHPLLRLGAVAMVLALGTLVAIGPGYRVFKQWRMDRILTAAQRAAESGRMQEARDLSLTVLRSSGMDIDALRVFARSTGSLRDPRHGNISRALLSHPDNTRDDRNTAFAAIAAGMPLGIVGEAWTLLPEDDRTHPPFAAAFADRLLAESRLGEAAQVLLALPEETRDDTARLHLARILVASGHEAGFEEAQRMIAQAITQEEDVQTAAWIELLEQIPIAHLQDTILSPAISPSTNRQLDLDPAHLAVVATRIEQANSEAPTRIDAWIDAWRESAPNPLAKLLLDLEHHHALFEAFPISKVEENPELMPLWVESAWQRGDWNLLQSLSDQATGHLPEHLRLAHRAIASANLGDTATRSQSWRAAIAEAQADPTNHAMLELHAIADRAGLQELAINAMLEAIRAGTGPLPLYEDLRPVYQALAATGQDRNLLEICAIYLHFEPANPILLTQYAYLAVLTDVLDPAIIIPRLEFLAEAFPNEMPLHATLAALHLCAGDPESAARVLAPFDVDPDALAPPFRITFLTTRVLNGEKPADHPSIERFPWSELHDFERRKFTTLLRNAP